jgi:hypothetical protein
LKVNEERGAPIFDELARPAKLLDVEHHHRRKGETSNEDESGESAMAQKNGARGRGPVDGTREAQSLGSNGAEAQVGTAAAGFLQLLRAGGPWVLSAIAPDGPIETATVFTAEGVHRFVAAWNGERNLYYLVNRSRGVLHSKAKKQDMAAVEFVFADLDPRADETPQQGKERYLSALAGNGLPPPTFLVDSGNGIQALWRLTPAVELPPVDTPEWERTVAHSEGVNKAITLKLGGTAGTQNIDRILRLPGTINIPNKKKKREGRVQCEATLPEAREAAYPVHALPQPGPQDAPDFEPQPEPQAEPDSDSKKAKTKAKKAEQDAQQAEDDADKLERAIRTGGDLPAGQRSELVWWVINELLRYGYRAAHVEAVLLDRRNGIAAHIYDQSNPRAYAKRQIKQAIGKIDFWRGDKGVPYVTPSNICVALLKLGVTITYDSFADRTLIDGLKDFGPALDDGAVTRIWLQLIRRFHFGPGKNLLFDVIKDAAKLNSFHPVRDYLDSLRWDGEKRLDTWLTDYAGAEDTPYTQAIGKLMLVAAVRRVRQPGCKFDEMVVLESEQGTVKSTALEVMAVRKEWFSDDLPLDAESRRVIESLRGRWIVEAAELSGMRHADVEHLKAFLSRTVDRARMSYDRTNTEHLRQCIVVGTTNAQMYLRDTTGNRRYWPVSIMQFNLVALERDRDQLWAEAAVREAAGDSIRLDPALYKAAADEQIQREVDEPWIDVVRSALGDMQGRIAAQSIWIILDMKGGAQAQMHNQRMGEAMRKNGWKRPNKAGLVSIEGKMVSGYIKGEQPWQGIKAERSYDRDSGTHHLAVFYIDDKGNPLPDKAVPTPPVKADPNDEIPF